MMTMIMKYFHCITFSYQNRRRSAVYGITRLVPTVRIAFITMEPTHVQHSVAQFCLDLWRLGVQLLDSARRWLCQGWQKAQLSLG